MNDVTPQTDVLQRFLFDNAPIRGEWVNLQESWREVLKRRDYPPAIRRVLGEMMGAAALLAATVKISGRLVLQIRSEGPATLLMVECTSQHTLRAFAQWNGHIGDDADLAAVTGQGTLAITIEMDGARQPYQGVVSLQGQSISDTLETYFRQSEQLATRIWLAASDYGIAGLLLQQLPGEIKQRHEAEEHWSRITRLAATVSTQELLELDVKTLLHRLFHEEQVRLFEPTGLSFACTCSRERVAETIVLLGREEADEVLQEQGKIEVACEFCNQHYHFDSVDVAELFSDGIRAGVPDVLH